MAKRSGADVYTDDQIRAYGNVPLSVASRYLHTNNNTLKVAMLKGRCPIGFAVSTETGHTKYVIPADRLIKWRRGDSVTAGHDVADKILREMLDTVRGLSYEMAVTP